ncbi:MAG TPA: GyrI-like domain-containing protein [Gemmata sp.]|jgi:effector-binding domain-containing protein|nr:GyrI-like domain-containing protein [Gemmata sp.]
MEYDIRLEQVSIRPLAVVRRHASLPELAKTIPEACGTVWSILRSLKIAGAGRHVVLYRDDEFNLEVGVELDTPFTGHEEVVGSATPGGTVATAVHFGPYNGLPKAHRAIRRWCLEHGYSLAGLNWEIYAHWLHEWCDDPSKIRTDVFYLVNKDLDSAT